MTCCNLQTLCILHTHRSYPILQYKAADTRILFPHSGRFTKNSLHRRPGNREAIRYIGGVSWRGAMCHGRAVAAWRNRGWGVAMGVVAARRAIPSVALGRREGREVIEGYLVVSRADFRDAVPRVDDQSPALLEFFGQAHLEAVAARDRSIAKRCGKRNRAGAVRCRHKAGELPLPFHEGPVETKNPFRNGRCGPGGRRTRERQTKSGIGSKSRGNRGRGHSPVSR